MSVIGYGLETTIDRARAAADVALTHKQQPVNFHHALLSFDRGIRREISVEILPFLFEFELEWHATVLSSVATRRFCPFAARVASFGVFVICDDGLVGARLFEIGIDDEAAR